MFSIEISIKNYIESWGQTFGTPDFDLRVRSVLASGSEVPGVEQIKTDNLGKKELAAAARQRLLPQNKTKVPRTLLEVFGT